MILGCGDCYGADSAFIRCCGTCNDVIKAYKEANWAYDVNDFIQCG